MSYEKQSEAVKALIRRIAKQQNISVKEAAERLKIASVPRAKPKT